MRHFLFFLSFFLSLTSVGQLNQVQITGNCIDKKGAPIADVFIKFSGKKPGISYTDSLGNFNFLVSQNDTISISFKVEETITQKLITKPQKKFILCISII